MPVNKYEAFLKAAELGSLTRAAAELGVTQSAVSHMIGALEEELGFSLLKRGRGGARATADGERVLPAIRRHAELTRAAGADGGRHPRP